MSNIQHTREWFNSHKHIYNDKERICVNCSSTDDLHLHHIVPLALGGTNYPTNVVVLCGECHSKVHNVSLTDSGKLISEANKNRARGGTKACGVAPIGYKWNDKAEIVIDEERAEVVRDIFKMYNNDLSLQKIADKLTEEGITTNKGNKFSRQSISDILKNDFYCGIVTHSDVKKEGNHQAIISKVVFGRTQSKMNKNRRNKC